MYLRISHDMRLLMLHMHIYVRSFVCVYVALVSLMHQGVHSTSIQFQLQCIFMNGKRINVIFLVARCFVYRLLDDKMKQNRQLF